MGTCRGWLRRFFVLLVPLSFLGCKQDQKAAEDRTMDIFLVRSVQDTAMKNAIIAQHTLFPYHFVANGDELNDLGKVDFNVLATHFLDHPGQLNIRKGDVSKELYDARVSRVRALLEARGIPGPSIEIADDLPGGAGMQSENVLKILRREDQQRSEGSRRDERSSTSMGSTTGSGTRSGTYR